MLNWIRDKLRSWLAEEQKVDAIECVLNGRICRAAILDAVGMKLMVSTGEDQYLIGHDQVLNPTDFWKAWGQRSKGEYMWDDGSSFKPEGMK